MRGVLNTQTYCDIIHKYQRYGINLDSSTYERIKKIFMPMQRNIGHKYI